MNLLRVTAIGTGTAAPHPSRVQSGLLVEGEGLRLLIDCGSGVVFRMAGLGIRWPEITHVAITHFHADHTSDLATLLFAWRWGLLPPRTAPVTIIGPAGTKALLLRHAAALGPSLLETVPDLTISEISPTTPISLLDKVSLEALKVPHSEESVAYSVTVGERRVVVTGDTAFDSELAKWARGCDLLVCECSLPDSLAHPFHLTPRQCGALAATARPGLLALTHFYPPVESVDVVTEVRELYDGPVALCHDGWTFDL